MSISESTELPEMGNYGRQLILIAQGGFRNRTPECAKMVFRGEHRIRDINNTTLNVGRTLTHRDAPRVDVVHILAIPFVASRDGGSMVVQEHGTVSTQVHDRTSD
jgi:hypothetical protein